MKNYCIFEVYNDHGGLYTTFAANFVSRGIKHSQSMIDTYCSVYKQAFSHRSNYKINFQIFFNATNPAFMPNQMKVYRGKVSGCPSHQIARKDQLLHCKGLNND